MSATPAPGRTAVSASTPGATRDQPEGGHIDRQRQSRRVAPPRLTTPGLYAVLAAFTIAFALAARCLTPGFPFTHDLITIDGRFDDWARVVNDGDRVNADTVLADDPDGPCQPGRDLSRVAVTSDDAHVYLYWRRTAADDLATTFAAYVDRDGDGLLQDTDVAVLATLGGSRGTAPGTIVRYHPATPAGDTMGHDGVTPAGTADGQTGTLPGPKPYAALRADGVEVEMRIPWTSLDLPPGTVINIHLMVSDGDKLGPRPSGQIADNADTIRSSLGGLSVTRGIDAAATVPGTAMTYTHLLTNTGSDPETFTVRSSSTAGWANAVRDPARGAQIDAVTLGPGETAKVVVVVSVPFAAREGTRDTTTLRVASSGDPGVWTETAHLTTVRSPSRAGTAPTVTDIEPHDGLRSGSGTTGRDGRGTTVTRSLAGDTFPNSPRHATITSLAASDAPTIGSTVSVTSSMTNTGKAAVANATMTYVIWWDTDGDGSFGVGDLFIDAAGSPQTYYGAGTPSTHVTTGIHILRGSSWSEPSPWTVDNRQFPNEGTYRVTATVTLASGAVIDAKTATFYSVPILGWPLLALAAAVGAGSLWCRLRRTPGVRVLEATA